MAIDPERVLEMLADLHQVTALANDQANRYQATLAAWTQQIAQATDLSQLQHQLGITPAEPVNDPLTDEAGQ